MGERMQIRVLSPIVRQGVQFRIHPGNIPATWGKPHGAGRILDEELMPCEKGMRAPMEIRFRNLVARAEFLPIRLQLQPQ